MSVKGFYDELALWYHLLYDDWDRAIARQAAVLGPLLERSTGRLSPRDLDCACGVGTQALGLAQRGHEVTGSDLSPVAIDRARSEANNRDLDVLFSVADVRDLSFAGTNFDVVLAADNALPHLLSDDDLLEALRSMAVTLSPDGILIATLRDYDRLLQERPSVQAPSFFEDSSGRRFVHQVWDWVGDQYDVHLYLTMHSTDDPSGWTAKHFQSRYRALKRADLHAALRRVGFHHIRWLDPTESGFYQPIVIAKR